MGKFAPTLRNIAVTAPYMHDGSIATLEGVLDRLRAACRPSHRIRAERGVGHDNPNKDSRIAGFELSKQDRVEDLIESLGPHRRRTAARSPLSDPGL